MALTNIFCTRPNWASNLNPNVGFAVQGDNNVANCLSQGIGDGKLIKVNWYWCNANSWFFTNYDISAIPASVTITSLTGYWYSTRQGGGNGVAQMRHRIGTSPEVIHVANHVPQNGAWVSGVMAKPGGGSWTRADVANLQTRIVRGGGASQDNDTRWDQHYVSVNWSYTTPSGLYAAHQDVTVDGGTITGGYNANGEAGTTYSFHYKIGSDPIVYPPYKPATGSGAVVCDPQIVTGAGPGTNVQYWLSVDHNSGMTGIGPYNFTTLSPPAGFNFIPYIH